VTSEFVLLLDDDKDIVKLVSRFLQEQKVNINAFSDPATAMEYFKENFKDCALVICDIRMPGMNGFQFVRKARELKPDLKVIFMTSFEIHITEFEKIHPSMKINGLIKKPILMRKLVALIQNTMTATAAVPNEKQVV
jgi:DNA-binding NtrC family response regulator